MSAPVCARSWGSQAAGWRFCVRERGHLGPCEGYDGHKPPEALFFEQQPAAAAAIAKQIAEEQKMRLKKGQSID